MAIILVADDDSSVRQVLRHILEAGDHQVWEASDGDRAAYLGISLSFDLVIMDLIMRRTTGLQAARKILRAKPGQKIIFMSGLVSLSVREFRKTAEELGVHRFLTKPFCGDEVVDAVVGALSQ